jgi:hypothetical protein
LDFAAMSRDGENPARWRDNLDQLLPKRSEIRKVKHHPALRRSPQAEVRRAGCRDSD